MIKKLCVALFLMTLVLGSYDLSEGSIHIWKITAEIDQVGDPLKDFFSKGDIVEYIFSFDT
jgi:hypothetical protein